MNGKIQKVEAEIEKVKAKITAQQARLRELEQQKTELENTEIVGMVRGLDVSPGRTGDAHSATAAARLAVRLLLYPQKRRIWKMKNKLRSLTALLAVVLCASVFSIPAYAQSSEPQTEQAAEETAEPEQATPNPFTPKGTGTVLDNATSEDEKEFYTIVTPDENVFYLVIDKQRDADNVYFLNAVTESDLMALAEKDGDTTTDSRWSRNRNLRSHPSRRNL